MNILLAVFCTYVVLAPHRGFALNENDVRKNQLEDIFIWKISDELKLTAKEEKDFTELSKSLNKKKFEINKQIHDAIQDLNEPTKSEASLKKYRKLMADYNQLALTEYDSIKKLLGTKKFVSYLRIKNELTSKVKSLLVGDKDRSSDKKEPTAKLPPPKVIVEK